MMSRFWTGILKSSCLVATLGLLVQAPMPIATAQEISLNTQSVSISEDQVESIGGFWYVSKAEPKTYYYRDAGRWLDLFSYHSKDSNNCGKSFYPQILPTHQCDILYVHLQTLNHKAQDLRWEYQHR